MRPKKERLFTRYQVFMIALIALLQFTVILDFMVLNPLGEILLSEMNIKTEQFGLVVSGYAFSAGISGILAAGFADRFDRKKMLMVFYTGFVAGTFLCALAPSYPFLLGARIITGLFGGVMGAIGMAIIADLFLPEVRGRVMGFVQMAFGLSQVVGIPIGWELANRFSWHAPFWMIGIFGVVIGIIMMVYVKPITGHLAGQTDKNAFRHLLHTLSNRNYFLAFGTTMVLTVGGYMMMPFGSTFSRHNLGLSETDVTILFVASGLLSFILGPIIGKLSDKFGKANMFYAASLLTAVMVYIYTNLGITPLYLAIIVSGIMFVGVFGRVIPSQAIMTSMPAMHDRGAFMSINSSLQQLSGGIAAFVAGRIVVQTSSGTLLHYDRLGYVMIVVFAITTVMMYLLNRQIMAKQTQPPPVVAAAS